MSCECGNEPSTEQCCGAFIKGERKPETAEALMRSRYTAYVLGEIDYIMATHDPATVEEADRRSAAEWSKEATWRGLTIHETRQGSATDDEGEVEFTARCEIRGRLLAHREKASFRKKDGAWFYHSGEMIKSEPVKVGPKIGRNQPCPCGSGKKHKKCCGR